ncbi:unnamed protein product [Rotaria sordida]|uniref:F-box domain-containing protein n=1 Tax=Rotaria sordida TaxID=392033 RepID=A0A814BKW0_9BILA|nr:unnamed protein product [Rotaria sordida]CAF3886453.1 unnamed protein product [Rotaria sordida]
MEYSYDQLSHLPDEILMIIFKELHNISLFYSLIGVNRRLNKIIHDSIFTNRLTFLRFLPVPLTEFNDLPSYLAYSLPDPIVNRFCFQILPRIHNKIEWLNVEPFSMKRIFLATNYPNLSGLGLYNIQVEQAMHLFSKLHVYLKNFNDCLYLLDGRFNQLRILHVNIDCIIISNLTINNKEKLPNLKSFSLYCNRCTKFYDESILPLLHRMLNLENLHLSVKVYGNKTFHNGNDLKINIINHMPLLNKFTFNICSLSSFYSKTNLPSNEDIQKTFKDFKDNQIISCIDYFQKRKLSRCHIYSYPYQLKYYDDITNNFSGELCKCVREVGLYDEHPFEHEFFLRIAQSFPLLEKLTVINQQRQNNKRFRKSKNENEDLLIVKYPHLIQLNLSEAHKDYHEQFLFDTKTCLPNDVRIRIDYRLVKKVTRNFRRNTTRSNCAKLSYIVFRNKLKFPEHLKDYFPHAHIY